VNQNTHVLSSFIFTITCKIRDCHGEILILLLLSNKKWSSINFFHNVSTFVASLQLSVIFNAFFLKTIYWSKVLHVSSPIHSSSAPALARSMCENEQSSPGKKIECIFLRVTRIIFLFLLLLHLNTIQDTI
jgi:hypothetical protein